jgi:dihydrofolate reductase
MSTLVYELCRRPDVVPDEFLGRDESYQHDKKTGGRDAQGSVDVMMTLDGVVQAPGSLVEDTNGGFKHGGWALQYFDEVARAWLVGGYEQVGGFLLGRRTHEILGSYWPTAPEEQRAIGDPLNPLPKHVASRTLTEPLEWQNSHLLEGDVAEAVAALKEEDAKELRVVGSGNLLQTRA